MKIDHFALSVSSIEDSVKWYKKVLGASVKQRDKEKEAILNLKQIDELINSFKDNKEWNPDLSLFWKIMLVSYKK